MTTLPWVWNGHQEGGEEEAREAGPHIDRPPAQAQQVGPRQVDAEALGETEAQVHSEVEDTSGRSSGLGREEVGEEGDHDWGAGRLPGGEGVA